jgi:hypothetical protein
MQLELSVSEKRSATLAHSVCRVMSFRFRHAWTYFFHPVIIDLIVFLQFVRMLNLYCHDDDLSFLFSFPCKYVVVCITQNCDGENFQYQNALSAQNTKSGFQNTVCMYVRLTAPWTSGRVLLIFSTKECMRHASVSAEHERSCPSYASQNTKWRFPLERL